MNKKGFTLVELLAVIAILAILVIIALPNVMGMFNTAKENSFKTEVKEVFKTAQQEWIQDSMYSTGEQEYSRCSTCSGKSLNLSGRTELEYYIKLNKSGKVVEYYATDGTFQYSFSDPDGLEIEKIDTVQKVAEVPTEEIVKIVDDSVEFTVVIPPENDMVMRASGNPVGKNDNFLRSNIKRGNIESVTFTNSITGHTANGTDCWDISKGENGSVLLWATDSDSNGLYEVTIGANGKVFIYDGSYLFMDMINLTQFNNMKYLDTSQTKIMRGMFAGLKSITSIDLSHFNTSSATIMENMFACYKNLYYTAGNGDTGSTDYITNLTSLDVSKFNTENVTTMAGMFDGQSRLTSLNLSNFNTKKVGSMNYMFRGCLGLTTLDLSSFNTSNVVNMKGMFSVETGDSCGGICNVRINGGTEYLGYTNYGSFTLSNYPSFSLTTIYVGSEFDTSKVTSYKQMFYGTDNLVGSQGTTYSSSNTGITYAHVDGGTSNPGYLTSK